VSPPQAPVSPRSAPPPVSPPPASVSPPQAPVSPRSAPTKTSGTPHAPAASGDARAPTLIGVPSARSADATIARPTRDEAVTAVVLPPQETRAPGASFTLPANPLSELGPDDLASFIDCTLFESNEAGPEEIESGAIVVDDAGPTAEIDPLAPARPFVIPGPSAEALLAPAPPLFAAKPPRGKRDLKQQALELGRRYAVPAACLAAGLIVGLIILRPSRVRPPAAPAAPAATRAPEPPPSVAAPAPAPAREVVAAPAPEVAASAPAREAAANAPAREVAPAAPAREVVAAPSAPPAKVSPVPGAPAPKVVATTEAPPLPAAPSRKLAAPEEKEEAPEAAPAAATARRAARDSAPSGAGEGGDCVVSVVTEPSEAKVTWGSKVIGVTPIEHARVPCGAASVTFHRDRYQPVTRDLVAKGDGTAVSQKLHRPPATLVLGSSPSHAEISVNGQSQGFTPKRVAVSRFESVSIQVALSGYAPWKKTVYVREAETRLGATLNRADAGKRSAGR
jgi:hypothetical protein